MYGKVIGTSTIVPGVVGVTMLPKTGGFRLMFIASAVALTVGVLTLSFSLISTLKHRSDQA